MRQILFCSKYNKVVVDLLDWKDSLTYMYVYLKRKGDMRQIFCICRISEQMSLCVYLRTHMHSPVVWLFAQMLLSGIVATLHTNLQFIT